MTVPRQAALALIALGLGLGAHGAWIPAKAALAQVLLDRAWAEARAGNAAATPWPWADIAPVAAISVPRLGARRIVLGGTSGEAMAFGPGHMSNTAPLGEAGTAVIAGHRDTHMRFVRDLVPGDAIELETADGRRLGYAVIGTSVVDAGASGLDPEVAGPTGGRLALVTCYPFDGIVGGPLRYLVLAERRD